MDQNEKKLCLSRFTVQNDISRRFFHFFKILIFRVVREVKGQKLVQNFKNSVCRAYLWNHTSYGYLCYTSVKWKYHQLFFSFYQNFYFCVVRRVIVKKWPKMTTNTVRCALYLRNHTPYDLNSWHTGVKG